MSQRCQGGAIAPGAELVCSLDAREYDRLATVSHSTARQGNAATECPSSATAAPRDGSTSTPSRHFFEPADADYRPVAPGQLSHTVLVTNLANRVQPILRYDLGDSILERPAPCPCGNPPPAIRVRGRAADEERELTASGKSRTVIPLA